MIGSWEDISGGKRRPPPKAEMLVEYHSTIVEDAIVKYSGHPLILVGKSMGSRSVFYFILQSPN